MIFNSLPFLLFFLPVVLVLFFGVLRGVARVWFLLVASLFFYALSGVEHAAILVAGVVWTYLITVSPSTPGSRLRLAAAVTGPVLALIYYKYSGFLLGLASLDGNEAATFSLFEDVVLPAGISFFTFQLVAYAIDRYRGAIAQPPRFDAFALYVGFFPQLVAGPILRFQQVAEGLAGLPQFRLRADVTMGGIAYIVIGLALKVLIADSLGNYNGPWIAQPASLSVPAALYVLFSYSFQIYFDFFGYSMVAIGLGRLFGFTFPDNFARPYQSLNIKDFWRRWHITLSFWIRDYLYLPLGGNRHYLRNIVIVFTICGLWHGAGLPFIVWGLYHGVLVALYNATRAHWDRLPRPLQAALTFAFVSLGWTLFIFDFGEAQSFFTSLLGLGSGTLTDPTFEHWAVLGLAAVVCFAPGMERLLARAETRANWVDAAGYALLFMSILLFLNRSSTFIYFRF